MYPMHNLYAILKVEPSATAEEIDTAFQRAMRAAQSGDLRAWLAALLGRSAARIAFAHAVLRDAERRRHYDAWLESRNRLVTPVI